MADSDPKPNRLPVCVTEYIERVIRKMGYRRKVRREVQRELLDHFEDALTDCKGEAEKLQLAEELINQFGDARLLAKLIRRGKKRCRPAWQKAFIRGFQAMGIFIVLFSLYAVWFINGKPTIRVDYVAKFNELAQPKTAEDENAWPYYQKAIELYQPPDENVKQFIDSRRRYGYFAYSFDDLPVDEQKKIEEFIDQHAAAWQNLSPEHKQIIREGIKIDSVDNFSLQEIVDIVRNYFQPYIITEENRRDFSSPIRLAKAYFASEEDFKFAMATAVLREWIKQGKNRLPTDPEFTVSLRNWLGENEAAWKELETGSRKRNCWRHYQKDSALWSNQDHFPREDFNDLLEVGLWRIRHLVQDNQIKQALEDCLDMIRVGAHLQNNPTLIAQLMGICFTVNAHQELIRLVGIGTITVDLCQQTTEQLEKIYSSGFPLIDFQAEKLFFLDTVQHIFTEGGLGGGHVIPKQFSRFEGDISGSSKNKEMYEIPDALRIFLVSFFSARRDEMTAKSDEFYNKGAEIAKLSPYERHSKNINFDDMVKSLPRRYILLNIFLPPFDLVGDRAFRNKALYQATITIFALQRWKIEKGAYPNSLQELLDAGFIKQLPQDPYSDGSLIYRRQGDDFTLYSVGEDFADNGGVENAGWGSKENGGDHVFWPVQE